MKIKKLLLEKYTEQRIASVYYYLTLHKIQKQVEEKAHLHCGMDRFCIHTYIYELQHKWRITSPFQFPQGGEGGGGKKKVKREFTIYLIFFSLEVHACNNYIW